MTSAEIREKFLKFFEKRGHRVVPSSSLVPDDPSVLLTPAGMQQFKKYFTGELDPLQSPFKSKNVVSIQKCFRTSDIDEVGDESHLTFFEMLGNFSFGSYWKEDAIKYAWDFITNKEKDGGLAISEDRIHVTVNGAPPLLDDESRKIWKDKIGLPENKIKDGSMEDNFWGPTGSEGPCGPTTEIYVDDIEIWNIVFNQFYCPVSRGEFLKNSSAIVLKDLPFRGIDTGMGLERLATVVQGKKNIFETDLFAPIFAKMPPDLPERVRRIAADHIRGATFLLTDGVRPSNKEAGYILRRLLRRVFAYEELHRLRPDFFEELVKVVIEEYAPFYAELKEKRNEIINEGWAERERFQKTVKNGLKELERIDSINSVSAFKIFESYGLPYEIIKEIGGEKAKNLTRGAFDEEFKKHQEISRAGAEKKFGGHGLILDTGELKAGNEEELKKVLRLHTATHLLQQALREVLGPDVHQMGSDITSERTRFDFAFPRKLTPEEIKKTEDIVIEKIKEDLPVGFVELPKAEAEKTGALYYFKEKYPEKVKVYFVGRDLQFAWSKEFCGGPHVNHTGEIGKFKIAKEEAVGAGARRIRGVVDF